MNIENFIRGFRTIMSHATMPCACGKVFYNPNGDWDWDEGEMEALEKSEATAIEHSVGEVPFEGKVYADACTCWHDRAIMIMKFIDSHRYGIADYLSLEKKRKQAEADASPVVTD